MTTNNEINWDAEDIAEVIHVGLVAARVCVPDNWDDEKIVAFTKTEVDYVSSVCQEGDDILGGTSARINCAEREGYVHVVVKE